MGKLAKVATVAPIGFDGRLIEVESDLSRGLPGVQIVGLGDKSISEAKERIKSAISNSLLEYPNKRITINLAPAELPKDGTHYDLPICLAVLASSGQLRIDEVVGSVFAGELALDGRLRATNGAITIAETAKKAGFTTIYLPEANARQAALVDDIRIFGVKDLKSLYLHLKGEHLLSPYEGTVDPTDSPNTSNSYTYLDDIKGQEQAKRALIIAAAGRHNLILSGPPGAGKTMLGKTLASLLPQPTAAEKLAITKIHSLAGENIGDIAVSRPFRSPHHTSSRVSLIGGGAKPKPGEVSLAHLGVLFLDEAPEYPRTVLESLRQPLEDREVSVTRAGGRATYPADFIMMATMNPCPCGYFGDESRECTCSSMQILNYQQRLSGPLMDRIDLRVLVTRTPNSELLADRSMDNKQHLLASELIKNAHTRQINRYGSSLKHNANLTNRDVKQYMPLSPEVAGFLSKAAEKLSLSARSYFKIIKVARTIADLESVDDIKVEHISEALQYRDLTP